MTATSDARFSSLHTQLSVADTRALQTAAAHAGVTVSAVVLQAYGAVIAASSGLDVCGISVPISQRPSTNTAQQGSREVLGKLTNLPSVPWVRKAPSPTSTAPWGISATAPLPDSRDIARAGRAAYRWSLPPLPVWPPSTAVVPSPPVGSSPAPPVCNWTARLAWWATSWNCAGTTRWSNHAQRLHHLFTRFVDQVTAFSADPAPNELDAELADLAQQLATSQPPSPQALWLRP
ncbi:MAG: hypothetical protein U1U88_001200 [Lawsonella clevelandensis]